jgi:hypothetical protein
MAPSKETGEKPFANFDDLFVKEHETHETHALEVLGALEYGSKCNLGGFFDGVAEHASRDGREGNGLYAVLLGDLESISIAGGKEFRLGFVGAVDGAKDVYNVAVRETMAAGYDGLAGADRG